MSAVFFQNSPVCIEIALLRIINPVRHKTDRRIKIDMKATGIVRRIDDCVKLGLNPANPVVSTSSADFIHICALDGLMFLVIVCWLINSSFGLCIEVL